MGYRLRYLHHDLELTEGEFTLGRSTSCQLSLDDPLVSRRHALLVVGPAHVELEDLGSRNGVLVNGKRVTGRVVLSGGDRIGIGSQELTLAISKEKSKGLMRTSSSAQLNRTLPRVVAGESIPSPIATDAPPAEAHVSSSPPPAAKSASQPPEEPSILRRAQAMSLLASVAEKSLVMGRADEAERLVTAPLSDLIVDIRAGKKVSSPLVDTAGKLAARLATVTSKAAWIDYVIELYDLQGRPCPAPVIDELYAASRKATTLDLARLRSYVGSLREKVPNYGPADRFLFQRLEGLERQIVAR